MTTYRFGNNTYFFKPKNNPKDRIEIEIGDSKQLDFKPQVKIMRWDNEINFSLRAQEDLQAQVLTEGEKIKYITPDYEIHQYNKPEVAEDGGFEFEWVLLKKPASNVLTATIQTKGLNFFYQPPLTQQEIDEGASRPENVVGSYAVYHKTKGGMNDAAGMEYKAGKAFHIYRPKVADANGDEIWGELNIDEQNGLLIVTIDQTWLDNAIYPIKVDPTFGYTSIGATTSNLSSNNMRGSRPWAPSSSGTINTMSFYHAANSTTESYRGVLYLNSDLSRLTFSSEATVSATQWADSDVTDVSITSGTDYVIALWFSSTGTLWSARYDTLSGKNLSRDDTAYHATNDPPNPFTENTVISDRQYSFYATYTTSGTTTSTSTTSTSSSTSTTTSTSTSTTSTSSSTSTSTTSTSSSTSTTSTSSSTSTSTTSTLSSTSTTSTSSSTSTSTTSTSSSTSTSTTSTSSSTSTSTTSTSSSTSTTSTSSSTSTSTTTTSTSTSTTSTSSSTSTTSTSSSTTTSTSTSTTSTSSSTSTSSLTTSTSTSTTTTSTSSTTTTTSTSSSTSTTSTSTTQTMPLEGDIEYVEEQVAYTDRDEIDSVGEI